jgi:hypothetical protein
MQQGTSALSSSALATSTIGRASAVTPHTSPLPLNQDVDMSNAELSAVIAPIVIHNPKEPVSTEYKMSAIWCTNVLMCLKLAQSRPSYSSITLRC